MHAGRAGVAGLQPRPKPVQRIAAKALQQLSPTCQPLPTQRLRCQGWFCGFTNPAKQGVQAHGRQIFTSRAPGQAAPHW